MQSKLAAPAESDVRQDSIRRAIYIPFFSRLGVKHAIVLIVLVLLAMTVITGQQLRETVNEIERAAVGEGRAVGSVVAPMLPKLDKNPAEVKKYFDAIVTAQNHIDYIQVVDSDGVVIFENDRSLSNKPAPALFSGWISELSNRIKLDRTATSVDWSDQQGVDVFVALLPNPEFASADEIRQGRHLRIGIKFDEIVKRDTPRVIQRMVVFTLIVAFVMVLGLVLLLGVILRPLRELQKGLRALATGDLKYQVPVFSRDELGRLMQAFNATAERLRSAFDQIEAMAIHDPLTNLPNRRLFDERLANESARSRRYGHPFGLIVMDLDKFKSVNDQFGHPAGDEVLKAVATTIEANVRETDLPARVGGEEFAVILPETGMTEVKAVSEKLRSAVAECRLSAKHGLPEQFRMTISVGAVCSAGHLVTAESMIAAADAALYRSKGEGRNRVTVAPTGAGKTDFIQSVVEDKKKDEARKE